MAIACDGFIPIWARIESALFFNFYAWVLYSEFLNCDIKEPEPRNVNFPDAAEKAMNQGRLNTFGKTPEATMNAQLVTELKRANAGGEPGRFVQTSPGYYSLVKWMGTGLPCDTPGSPVEFHRMMHCLNYPKKGKKDQKKHLYEFFDNTFFIYKD